jgi:hypothetical protein
MEVSSCASAGRYSAEVIANEDADSRNPKARDIRRMTISRVLKTGMHFMTCTAVLL